MTGKSRTSVSIDEHLHEQVKANPELNLSGLVNDFLQDYLAVGVDDPLTERVRRVEGRLEDLRRERTELDEKIDRVEEQLTALREKKATRDERRHERQAEVVEKLVNIRDDSLTPSNPAVQTQAQQLDIPREELVELVREAKQNGHASTDGVGVSP